MELNLNNWKIKLIRSTFEIYDENKLPKSLCMFFWTFISSIVIFPFALFTHLINIKFFMTNEKHDINMGFFPGVAILLIFGVIGFKMSMIFNFMHINASTSDSFVWWLSSRVGLFYYYATIALAFFISLLFIIFFVSNFVKKMKADREFKKQSSPEYIDKASQPRQPSVLFQYFKAVKEKACPIITYKN